MKIKVLLTLCFGIGMCFCGILGNSEPKYSGLYGSLAMLFILLTLIMVVINIITMFTFWLKEPPIILFIPIVLSITFIFLYNPALEYGRKVWISRFQRQLPEYQDVVRYIEKSKNIENGAIIDLPPEYRRLPYFIRADRDPNGILTVEFTYRERTLGFRGALYRSDDNPNNWSYATYKKIADNWYRMN